jgi:spermidine/putrescine transport system permease protein
VPFLLFVVSVGRFFTGSSTLTPQDLIHERKNMETVVVIIAFTGSCLFASCGPGVLCNCLQLLAQSPQWSGYSRIPVGELCQIFCRFFLSFHFAENPAGGLGNRYFVPGYGICSGLFFYKTESRFKPYLMVLVMLPFWISFIIRTLSWINILGDSGLINHVLIKMDLINTPLAMLYNEGAVIMGLLQYLLPFMIMNIYVSLDGIDKNLTEAAKSLGCTEWQAFREVTLPLSLPGVSAGCLLVFVLTCGTYLPPMILGGPGNEMIANLIFKRVIGTLDWPFGSAISVILLLLLVLIVYTYNRYLGINQIFKSMSNG